ncbi:hypothetical protein [Achromobacter sp. 2789STDY5608621]|uniref:hypothetical protein n=1 Tax=Achromobacter sp. 2789STDY5608621 TaxID=1806496 RepID=UPI0006C41166|nr:hypothetical protein [Achromobacter sp. 2789STDY5608621]CUJ30649.1 Uncharacterised protein [Achromobacter sp. 2789STDY5608621]
MSEELTKSLNRLSLCFVYLDGAYKLSRENIDDHAKRSILRFFFIQLDNLIGLTARAKNLLYRNGSINIKQKKTIEEKIAILEGSYGNAYDAIRDKVAAHTQPMDLIELLGWWNDIDKTTIEVLYDDAEEIKSSVARAAHITFSALPEQIPLQFPDNGKIAVRSSRTPSVSADRLSLAKQNVVSMIEGHETQKKAQAVLSIIDFLECNFSLTVAVDNPETLYKRVVFDIGWLLAIVDLCSLIDNLFKDDKYDKSLLTYWKEHGIKGHDMLFSLFQARELSLENELRDIRNKLAAHIDTEESILDTIIRFEKIDLAQVHSYAIRIVNAFRDACRVDIRTKVFLIHGMTVNAVSIARDSSVPFSE